MRKATAISAGLHVAVLVWATLSLSGKAYDVTPTESLPVDLVSDKDFSQMTKGAMDAPKPVEKPPVPTPKTVAGDFSRPLDARGTEPFWNVAIRGTTLTLTRPDQPILIATAPGAVIQPNEVLIFHVVVKDITGKPTPATPQQK